MNRFNIRKATVSDVDHIIHLITLRMKWMDDLNMNQWNTNGYFDAYPKHYFKENINHFYIAETNSIVAGAVCFYTEDERWDDHIECYYAHHLVSHPEYRGAGKALLLYGEQLSKKKGYDRIRLDSTRKDEKLTAFYTSLGYQPVAPFNEGGYHGMTREKKL